MKTYGAKNFIGFAKRISFLIDPKGTIQKIYLKVKPATHAYEVIEDLSNLQK